MDAKLRGTVCGIAAAVFYGTNPLGAMNLYADGISTTPPCSIVSAWPW